MIFSYLICNLLLLSYFSLSFAIKLHLHAFYQHLILLLIVFVMQFILCLIICLQQLFPFTTIINELPFTPLSITKFSVNFAFILTFQYPITIHISRASRQWRRSTSESHIIWTRTIARFETVSNGIYVNQTKDPLSTRDILHYQYSKKKKILLSLDSISFRLDRFFACRTNVARIF